jgi:hypothetical protein
VASTPWSGCAAASTTGWTSPKRCRSARAEGLRAAQTNEPKGPKTSAIAKPKEVNIELREKLLRAEHELSLGGGDLRTADDAPEDIATVMLVKLSLTKAERVARTILKKLNNERAPPVPHREFSAKEVTL